MIAATRLPPLAPTVSPARENVMSTRPLAASTCCANPEATPPWRMKLPSCTPRTFNTAGLYRTVRLIVEIAFAPLIMMGTVYGPPPTRKSGPETLTVTTAPPAGGCAAAPAVAAAAGGAVGWPPPPGAAAAGGCPGTPACAPVGGGCAPGAAAAPAGGGNTVPGVGD